MSQASPSSPEPAAASARPPPASWRLRASRWSARPGARDRHRGPGRGDRRARPWSATSRTPTTSRAWPRRSGPRLDVLVNNAGGALGLAPVAEADVDDWRAMFESNVIGTLQVTQALLPALDRVRRRDDRQRRLDRRPRRLRGRRRATPRPSTRSAAMTETLRLELVDQPVRVDGDRAGDGATEEFALTRFGGDQERADAVYAGVSEPLVAAGHRRGDRLDGRAPGPRQHRPAGHQAARPGRPAQGAPGRLTGALRRVSGVTTGAKGNATSG